VSAYQVAQMSGFAGSVAEWLASLEGPQGDVAVAYATSPMVYDSGTKTISINLLALVIDGGTA